jgi:Pyruvate/2-oxoacid:ferredoxin oxidoreductase delta subunit
MNLRHAACDQECSVCGLVCPTQSIRKLSLTERVHARVGTAVILRDTCIPWSRDRECLVCQTQCPYDAVSFRDDGAGHSVGLPVVDADKCNGCGRCEDRCPIKGDSAIVVIPEGEIRLSAGSYVDECRAQGLAFEDKNEGRDRFEWMGEELP